MSQVLIFADSPRDAYYISGLPEALAGSLDLTVVASPAAAAYLEQVGVAYQPLEGATPGKLLQRFQPQLVMASAPPDTDSFSLRLWQGAKREGLITAAYLDDRFRLRDRFRGASDDPLRYAPDYLWVVDSVMRAELETLGFPHRRLVICGHPHHDHVRTRFARLEQIGQQALRLRLGIHPKAGQKVLLFVADGPGPLSTKEYRRNLDYTLEGSGRFDERNQIVLEEIIYALGALSSRPYLALRVPNQVASELFEPYRQQVQLISQGGASLEYLYAADAVVGLSGMSLLEALLMDRPVLSILPRAEERHWLARPDLTPVANQSEEIVPALEQLLSQKLTIPDGELPRGATRRMSQALREWLTLAAT